MGNKRRKKKRYNNVRSKLNQSNILGKLIALIVFVIIIFAVFSVARNVFYYMTESGVDAANPYPVKGVDVSVFQQDIDWKGLEDEGIGFAFIKATEGSSHVDRNFEYNWKEAHKTDMKVGAYHFLSYDTSGATQAENYIDTVGVKWGMMPPAVDVEFYGKYIDHHPNAKKVHKVLDVMLEALEDKYNRKPIIYTNLYIYDTYISGRYDDYPVWISDPGISEALPDGRNWVFCQYTFRGVSENIAGGQKYVDMNVFNGSRWQFRRYNGK